MPEFLKKFRPFLSVFIRVYLWLIFLEGCGSLEVGRVKAPPSRSENPYAQNKPTSAKNVLFLGTGSTQGTFLMVMGDSGEEPAFVLKEPVLPEPPRWNPVEPSLAFFSSYHYPHEELFSVKADGTGREWLSLGTTRDACRDADWLPDGKGMVYISDGTDQSEIYLLEASAGERVRLTQSPMAVKISDPRVSPDGQRIAFVVSESDYSNIDVIVNGRPTRTYEWTKAGPGVHYRNPRWAPDGKWLLAETDRFGKREIVRIDADTYWEKRLTYSSPGESWEPRVSPDGRWICYTSNRGNGNAVYRMDAEGQQDRPESPPELRASQAAWYPDSKSLVFVGIDATGNAELYRVDADGGHLFKMTDSPEWVKSHPEVQGARW